MEIARVECFCKNCGDLFVFEKECQNRLEAEALEKWAAKKKTLCPKCYRGSQQLRTSQLSAELKLPAITGTEKQIQYAQSLRDRYVTKHEGAVRAALRELEKINPNRIPIVAQERNLRDADCVPEAFWCYGLFKEYICLTENRAQVLITQLREPVPAKK